MVQIVQMKVNFTFYLEIKVLESGGRVERHIINVCLKSSVKFTESVMIFCCHVICWCWSTVFSEVHSQRSHLPGNIRALHSSFCWQALEPAHTAKGTKSWFNDHGVTVLDWPANSPDLNPIENLGGNVKRKMRDTRPNNADDLKATIKATYASITPEQSHRLIASMPCRIDEVIHAKGGIAQILSA